MSTNTAIYFAEAEFPFAQWEEILTLFDAESREPHSSSIPCLAEWMVREKGAAVWCSLYPFRQKHLLGQSAHWTIATDSTRGAPDLLCVAHLAYAVLSWIPNTIFHDLNGRFCHTPEELLEIYIPHLEKRFAADNFNKMFEVGILDYDGKLKF